jgi:hypothetical protein
MPPLAPTLREVGVHLDWFGPLTPVAHRLAPLSGLAARLPGTDRVAQRLAAAVGARVEEAPSQATLERSRTHTVAEVRDRSGALVSRVQVSGPEAYGLTAAMLAWGATRAADGGVLTTGAVGPVQAFGLDALTAGAAEAGLARTRRSPASTSAPRSPRPRWSTRPPGSCWPPRRRRRRSTTSSPACWPPPPGSPTPRCSPAPARAGGSG